MMDPEETMAVSITNREIYDALQRLAQEMAEMRSDVRAAAMAQSGLAETSADHEDRLRAVERRVWAIPGIATILSVLGLALQFFRTTGGQQ